jgi:hypothetical protein
MAMLAVPASALTFGSPQLAAAVAIVGAVFLLKILAGSETALLQGAWRIGDLAKLTSSRHSWLLSFPCPLYSSGGKRRSFRHLFLLPLSHGRPPLWCSRHAVNRDAGSAPLPSSQEVRQHQ